MSRKPFTPLRLCSPHGGASSGALTDEVARYLTTVMDTEWFFDAFGPTPQVQVKEWKSRTRWAGCAIKSSFTLVLKVSGPIHEAVVLHELAHLLCEDAGHGQCFVDTQLVLIRNQMGFQAYAEYWHALRETGVFDA